MDFKVNRIVSKQFDENAEFMLAMNKRYLRKCLCTQYIYI